ncbi:MAG: peroxide stress protein YaaA [Acidimicrobiales bacterium]
MLAVVSPAKSLDFESKLKTRKFTEPRFVERSAELIDVLRSKSPDDIASLMSLSPALAELNADRYQDWEPTFARRVARPAILAFNGDVYIGMDTDRFSERDFTEAQKRIRILSGLHGLLRPLDMIRPYRLEMGTQLETPVGKNLYEFWGDEITQALNDDLAARKSTTLINLASNEYFAAVKKNQVNAKIVSPVFLDEKAGEAKVISFFAKRARGAMAAWIVLNRIKSARALRNFDELGYRYDPARSTAKSPTFVRSEELSGLGASAT